MHREKISYDLNIGERFYLGKKKDILPEEERFAFMYGYREWIVGMTSRRSELSAHNTYTVSL